MLFRLGIRNLFRNVRRTLAVVLTVALGTGSLFIFQGFNEGIMNQYRDNTIHARYGHGQIHTHGYREKVHEKPWEHWIQKYDGLKTELLAVEGVSQVFPRVSFSGLLTNGQITVSARGQGIDGKEEFSFFDTMNFVDGKNLSDEESGIVLGRGLARALDVGVGDEVTVLAKTVDGRTSRKDLEVTGIFHTGLKDFDDVIFRLPLEQTFDLLKTRGVEAVSIGLTSPDRWINVSSFVETRHPELEATSFAVLDKVYYQHSVDWLEAQFGVIQLIILTIVILGIFNTVSTSVLERKQEIGTLRANGESKGDVMKLLGLEGAALGFAGALLGVLLVVLLNATLLKDGILMPPAPGITRQFQVRIELQPMVAVETFVLGSIAALMATLFAGYRVVRIGISDLLRSV